MTKTKALWLFDRHDTDVIRVRKITSGIIYYLYRDVVEAAIDNYVYGYFAPRIIHKGQIYSHFFLEDVEYLQE